MSDVAGAVLVIFGSVGLGFALARWRRNLATAFGLLAAVGVGLLLLVPHEQLELPGLTPFP